MRIFSRRKEVQAFVDEQIARRRRIALVPTMGNLHAGHYTLIELARARADIVVASVFVNPTQFGPHEDFSRYPRTPDEDTEGLRAHGCDALFLPAVEEIYPYGLAASTRVHVPEITDVLEGALRPGHFDGVATVVAKLFNCVRPHVAVFGQKDYQQLLVIERLVQDLGYAIEIVRAPIAREANGLAMSSRNQYLSADEREHAQAIHATLQRLAQTLRATRAALETAAETAEIELRDAGFEPDYVRVLRAEDLHPAAAGDRALVALAAARLGSTRLIDNLLIDL
jgi:pantoate--beta-alanine ligase